MSWSDLAEPALAGALAGLQVEVTKADALSVSCAGTEASRALDSLIAQRWDFAVVPLSVELGDDGLPLEERERLVGERVMGLQQRGASVALTTIFRHVPEGHPQEGELRTQIRRINLMTKRLSHRLGCFVLDVDRELGREGGLALESDCFGGGEAAAELVLSELMVLACEAMGEHLHGVEA